MITLAEQFLIRLDHWDLLVSATLILVAGAVSIALRLRMEWRLGLASLRTVVQLLLIGYVLRWVFDIEAWWAISLVAACMIGLAARAASAQPMRRVRGMAWLAFATLVASSLLTTCAVTGVVIGAEYGFTPQYFIPLLGMALGNSLTGVSLCLDQILESLALRRAEVEMHLAHGATSWEAARDPIADAVRRGMIPIINSMMVVGIVSLPGMMTGQILAGADPLEAVKYQIMIMFMVAAATSGGCILIALLMYKRLFNQKHQLCAELIEKRANK